MSLPKRIPNKDNKHVKKDGKRPQGLQPNTKYYRQLRNAESDTDSIYYLGRTH